MEMRIDAAKSGDAAAKLGESDGSRREGLRYRHQNAEVRCLVSLRVMEGRRSVRSAGYHDAPLEMEMRMDPNPVLALLADWKSVYVKVRGLWSRGCCRAGSPLLRFHPSSTMYPKIRFETVLIFACNKIDGRGAIVD